MRQHLGQQLSRAGSLLLVLSCAAAVLQAAAQQPLTVVGRRDLAAARAHSRKLQTALAIAKDQSDKWRAVANTLLGAIVSAFTKETLDAAGQVASMLLAAPPSGAAQQPTAQIVQLPPNGPPSGINLKTDTPVDVGQPVHVDTPVKQTNYQWGGR